MNVNNKDQSNQQSDAVNSHKEKHDSKVEQGGKRDESVVSDKQQLAPEIGIISSR